jgi:hypothetical protein
VRPWPIFSLIFSLRPSRSLPAKPVQLNALFYKFGAYLTGMKSLLHLFLWGGAYFIGAKPIPLEWPMANYTVFI